MTDDITLDDTCTNTPEMTDGEKDAFFASFAQPEMSDEELDAMVAEYESRQIPDDHDGHHDSFYW